MINIIFILIVVIVILAVTPHLSREPYNNYKMNVKELFRHKLSKLCLKLGLNLKEKDYYNFIISSNDKQLNINFFKIVKPNLKNINNRFIITNMLVDNNIPIPKCNFFSRVKDENDIQLILQNLLIDFPVVLKPNSNNYNYNSVYPNIHSNKELKYLLSTYLSRKYSGSLIIQKFIPGKKYRILCYKNKIIDIIRLFTPYLVGDGETSIKDLILDNNQKLNKINPSLINNYCLKKNKYNIDTVLPDKKIFIVNDVVNSETSNKIKSIEIENIHPDNKLIFSKISSILDVDLFSIDFISKDINISFLKNDAKVIGINTSPCIGSYFLANKKYSVTFLDKIFTRFFNFS